MSVGLKERIRLLQERWTGPLGAMRLSQTIATMLDPDIPVTMRAPLTINVPPGVAPLNIRGFSSGDTLINITDTGGQQVGSIGFDDNGLTSQDANGEENEEQGGGGVFAGTVLSGSGDTYSVLLEGGVTILDAFNTVTVEQRPSSTDTIPEGTKVVVFERQNGTFFMNVPTFLSVLFALVLLWPFQLTILRLFC